MSESPDSSSRSRLPASAGSRDNTVADAVGQGAAATHGSTANAMAQLKAATADLHAAVEETMAISTRLATLGGYRDVLRMFYRAFAAIDGEIARHPATTSVPASERRRVRPSLEADLAELDRLLGESIEPLEVLPCQLHGTDPAILLGAMYVVEGSSLGGQVLGRHVRELHGRDVPFSYLTRYGDDLGPLWRSFGDFVNATLCDDASISRAIVAARATFARFFTADSSETGHQREWGQSAEGATAQRPPFSITAIPAQEVR